MAKAAKSCYAINYVYQLEIKLSPSEVHVGVLESLRELADNGLFQKKSTPPRWMARWKFSREGGSSALEIQVGGGVWS